MLVWSQQKLVLFVCFCFSTALEKYALAQFDFLIYLFDHKYNKKSCIVKYIFKCNLFLWCKTEFWASLPQSSVSHDPSEIILICWFDAQEAFLIIINVESSWAV